MRNNDKLEYLTIILVAIGCIVNGLGLLNIYCEYGAIYGLIIAICEMVFGLVLLVRTLLHIKRHYSK